MTSYLENNELFQFCVGSYQVSVVFPYYYNNNRGYITKAHLIYYMFN